MIRQLEKKVYNINKKTFHELNFGELDHCAGRTGVRLACLAMFNAAPLNHHGRPGYMNSLSRNRRKERSPKVLQNYIRGEGCKDYIFPHCYNCAMPKIQKGGK